jgi:tRNA-specific 2-thiouridylase
MSGGVDSSVAAALLIQQGYEVIGVMLRLWSEAGYEADNRCCAPEAMESARRVAAILGMPFYIIDAREYFFKSVVNFFIDGYANGLTPNPCLICNRQVRWEYLLHHALSLGADFLATGHYARLQEGRTGQIQLLRAADSEKDQSYVLHVLNQIQLRRALFPLGDFMKPTVRIMARDSGLPVAERPDSQDLCFLGDHTLREFLSRYSPQSFNPGAILNLDGKYLGQHQGLASYTIGQRKGLGISSDSPLYVVKKDLHNNVLFVGIRESLMQHELVAHNINWIACMPPENQFAAQVKIRYKAQPVQGLITVLEDQRVHINFTQPLRDITPGQAAVFYSGEICLGGGLIE